MNFKLFLLSASSMVNAASGTDMVNLGTAENFVILAKTGISTVPSSVVTGNIAVSPITSAAITGFNLAMDTSKMFATDSQTQLKGEAFAPNYGLSTASALTTAVLDMEAAYTDAAGRPNIDAAKLNLGGGDLSGKTLTSGVYTFDTDVIISTGNTLTFHGSSTDVFIIQTSKSVKQALATKVVLTGPSVEDGGDGTVAQAKNIFWVVAKEVVVDAGSHLEGILLVKTGVTFITGSSLNGRIFSQTAVTLQMATIAQTPYTQPTRRGLRGLQVA
jgi:hypothetical protein